MAKILVNDLTYYYDEIYHLVFENVSLILDSDWKLGLIGRNGKGKSTFLKLLSGQLKPQKGSMQVDISMALFPYEYDGNYTNTLDIVKECIGGLKTMEKVIYENPNAPDYMNILQRYDDCGGYQVEADICKEVEKMGLDNTLLAQEFSTLSGGEKICMMIIALFLRRDAFVLLDEPTSHLDTEKKKLLEAYLKKQKGFILVSHDFGFLDAVVDHILAINKTDINLEKGNYSTWKNNRMLREAFERAKQEKLIREIEKLENRSTVVRDWAAKGNKQKYDFVSHSRSNGNQNYMRQAKRAEQRVQENLEEKKKLLANLEEEHILSIFQEEADNKLLLEVSNLNFAYESGKQVLDGISLRVFEGDRIWIRGKNGVGKSTLLKLLTNVIGDAWKTTSVKSKEIIYENQISFSYSMQEPLWKQGFLSDYLEKDSDQANIFDDICLHFDLPSDFYERPLETLSSGELKKIDIARAISQKNNILFLDEPLNYMDYMFQNQLRKTLVEQNITVVFVEHNEDFGESVATKVIEI